MKNIITILVIITLSIIIGILSFIVLPWAKIYVGLHSLPAPPVPKITHGEFPFHLVYEVNGKQYTIDDTIICDYAGTGADEGNGKYVKWEVRLLNGNNITRFKFKTEDFQYGIDLFDGVIQGQGRTSIICDVGNPEFYLGYKKYTDYIPGRVSISSLRAVGIISEDELWNKYNIKIIEKKFSQPMEGNGIPASIYSKRQDILR